MYKRILVPVDGSAPARAGLREAIELAATTHATLVVLHVVSELPMLVSAAGYVNDGGLTEILMRNGREISQEAARAAEKAGIACELRVVDGGAAQVCDVIVDEIAAQSCDLVVMGTHGRRGMRRLALGSDAELVVRRAGVPVLLVKAAADAV